MPGQEYSQSSFSRLVGDVLDRVAVVPREPRQEEIDQRRDVLAALAQRRHRQVNDVQAVEQILAERPFRDHVAQVAVGRGDDADVDAAHRSIGADLLQLAGLHEPQQQALHAERHLADFVEEDAAAVGHFELALLVAIGAREASLDVPEQLGLEERFRQAGAVDRHHRAICARAALMDGVRHELLADAAFPGDEDLGVRPRDPVDFLRQLDDHGARADQLFRSLASHVHKFLLVPTPGHVTRTRLRLGLRPRIARHHVFAFLRKSSRLRRLRSSMDVNTAPRPMAVLRD